MNWKNINFKEELREFFGLRGIHFIVFLISFLAMVSIWLGYLFGVVSGEYSLSELRNWFIDSEKGHLIIRNTLISLGLILTYVFRVIIHYRKQKRLIDKE